MEPKKVEIPCTYIFDDVDYYLKEVSNAFNHMIKKWSTGRLPKIYDDVFWSTVSFNEPTAHKVAKQVKADFIDVFTDLGVSRLNIKVDKDLTNIEFVFGFR